uniref:Reverse transcriptase n=1 Tax=Ditylenchus dipsaci TaxID=166011 RepID=A0A915CXH3_9BILA
MCRLSDSTKREYDSNAVPATNNQIKKVRFADDIVAKDIEKKKKENMNTLLNAVSLSNIKKDKNILEM